MNIIKATLNLNMALDQMPRVKSLTNEQISIALHLAHVGPMSAPAFGILRKCTPQRHGKVMQPLERLGWVRREGEKARVKFLYLAPAMLCQLRSMANKDQPDHNASEHWEAIHRCWDLLSDFAQRYQLTRTDVHLLTLVNRAKFLSIDDAVAALGERESNTRRRAKRMDDRCLLNRNYEGSSHFRYVMQKTPTLIEELVAINRVFATT